MDLNSDLFTRKFFSSIESIVKKILSTSSYPRFIVGTVVTTYGTYPNQTADVLLAGGVDPIPNIQNASIHSLSNGDQVYVEMIYGNLTNPVIMVKKI
jgi:hypothetical protein